MHDLLILGGGIAGLTAAIYAARARLDTVLLEKSFVGGQALETAQIDNYPAVPHTDGITLMTAIAAQATDLGADIRSETVTGYQKTEAGFTVYTDKGEHAAKALLIATGARHRLLGVEGEERFAGRGVSYCATCDGRFYRGKVVAVVGGGNTALEDALYLSRQCERVYLIHRRDALRANRALQEDMEKTANITFLKSTEVKAIEGDDRVTQITLSDGTTLPVNGVFIAVGISPNNTLFSDLPKDDAGFLIADENGVTPTEGIFAAGDIRSKACRQLVTAAADGAAAIAAVERYLAH